MVKSAERSGAKIVCHFLRSWRALEESEVPPERSGEHKFPSDKARDEFPAFKLIA